MIRPSEPGQPPVRSSLLVRLLVVLGGVLAAAGLVAGHANREVMDGPTFARHVDVIRTDSAVVGHVGQAISGQILARNPDLIALRPVVDEVSVRVAGSDLLAGPTRLAARATHQALTEGDAGSVTLRLVDAGAVATAVLAATAPDRASAVGEVSVTLLSINERAVSASAVRVTGAIGVLAWLLPLAAVACFAAAIGLSRARWRTAASAGKATVVAAGTVGVLLAAGSFVMSRLDHGVLGGAVARASWDAIVRPMWWGVAFLAAIGIAIALASDPSGLRTMDRLRSSVRSLLPDRQKHPVAVALYAVIAATVGVAAIVDPLAVTELAIMGGGVVLVLLAIAAMSRLVSTQRGARTADSDADAPADVAADRAASERRRPSGVSWAVIAAVALAVVGGVVAQGRPGGVVEATATGTGAVCNGHAELCDRRFDEVAYVATHNSMSAATEPGWMLPEHFDRIPVQLEQGVRALLIDVWSGRQAGTVVRTAPESHEEALRVAEERLGSDVVAAALRIADAIAGEAEGPETRFLCHGLCETGSIPFIQSLDEIRTWMIANPDEVVTLFIQDETDASGIAEDIMAAGLVPMIHEPVVGEPWPTLGEMIRSGKRLVVMLEAGAGGPDAPWLVNGFEHTQDTSYSVPDADSFTCGPNRGAEDAPLFLLNHWLAGFSSLVSDAELVNGREILLPRAEQCQEERGMMPNFVAVNFATLGDVFEVVDVLNGAG